MALATLSIDLVAKLASFEADLGKAARIAEKQAAAIATAFDGVKTAVAGLGIAAIVTTQLTAVRAAIDKLDAIDDLAEKYGIAASKLQAYSYAGEVAGTTTEAFATGLNRLAKNMAAAAGGSAEQAAFFKTLGVSVKDAGGNLRSADDVLLDIAEKFAGYEDGAGKAALATAGFGKSGVDLIPVLNKGRDGIKELASEADKFGLVLGDAASKAAGDFNDNMKRLQLASEAAHLAIASKFLPGLVQLTETFLAARKEGGLLYGVLVSIGQGFAALTGQDELGKLQSQAKGQAAEIERLTGVLIGLDNVLQRDPGNDKARRRYDNLSAQLRKLQNDAVATGDKIKALADEALNPKASTGGTEKTAAPVINTKAAAAAEAAEKSYRKLIESIEERGRLARAELDNNTKLDESDKFRIASLAKLNLAENHYTEAMKAAGRAKIEQVARDIEAVESRERLRKVAEEAAAAEQAQLQVIESTSLARVEENRNVRDYIEFLGLTAEQIEAVRIKRLENALAVEQDAIRQAQLLDVGAATIIQMKESAGLLEQQIQLRKRLAAETARLSDDPLAGAKQGIKDYGQEAAKAGDLARQATKNTIDSLENDLTASLATGKISIKSTVDYMIQEMYRLQIVKPFLSSLFGSGDGQAGGFFGNLFKPGGSLSTAVASIFGFANGGAFGPGGVTPFASGGVFDSPHLFRFANGGAMQTGVMGEAGPEAIMPLRRAANGKLGVAAVGGGNHYSFSWNIDARGADPGAEQRIEQRLRQVKAETIAAVEAKANAGGRFARAMGRR